MVNVSASNTKREYIGHLTYQQSNDGTHTQKCADSCPVPYTGEPEECSGTIYCTGTVCDKCGQASGTGDGATHKGGTATCTEKAICELCNTEYGELDPTNHTGAPSGNYTYVDGTYHSAVFNCCGSGGASANEEHTSSDENELICSKCSGLAIDRVLEEIKNAPSGTTLSYSGVLGSAYSAYNKSIAMEIPEGVTVNWDVEIEGAFVTASGTALLTLSGGGTLNFTGSIQNTASASNSACIELANGSSVTLIVSAGGTVENSSASAIKAAGGKEIRIEDGTVRGTPGIISFASADVTVTGGSVTGTGSRGAVELSHETTPGLITVSGGKVTAANTVIDTYGAVSVSGSPTITGTGTSTHSDAIRAGSVEISGSPTISHSSGDGIQMHQSGPVVFKTGCNATVSGGQYGINDGCVTVEQGAKATVTGSNANDIYYSGSIPITVNGELTVKSDSSSSDALRASYATITVGMSGKLTAECGDRYGINCAELKVSGTVEATGGTQAGDGGISTGTLTIDGGTVTASGYNAVYCSDKISLTGGVLRATGNNIGIWPSSMEVSGDSHIVGTGDFKGVSCGTIQISNEDEYYWCSVAEANKPTDLHGYSREELSGSDDPNET